jgi:hypothetical protein
VSLLLEILQLVVVMQFRPEGLQWPLREVPLLPKEAPLQLKETLPLPKKPPNRRKSVV